MKAELAKLIENIESHDEFKEMCIVFSKSFLKMHHEKPYFFNYIYKERRINSVNILLSYLLSGKIENLSDFYRICSENNLAGKNNALYLMDFLTHCGVIDFVKGKSSDRRKKTPFLTKNGHEILVSVVGCFIKPLEMYDSSIHKEFSPDDAFLERYFNRYENFLLKSSHLIEAGSHLNQIYSKSCGFALALKIYIELLRGLIKEDSPIKPSHFKNYSYDLGVSQTHILNLMDILIEGGAVIKKEKRFFINKLCLHEIESLISFNLAFFYYCTKF